MASVSVCVGSGVSGVCETCATFCSTKRQYLGPKTAQIFRCAETKNGVRMGARFSLQRGERAPKKASILSYFLVFFSVAPLINSLSRTSREVKKRKNIN